MLEQEEILNFLKQNKKNFRENYRITKLGLFGSFLSGNNTENSDIDIFVSINKPSYRLLMGLYAYLEKKLNAKIDILRKGPHISERFLKQIHKDLIYV